MNNVKLSVLMPAYNVGEFIGKAIRSVLTQSLREFELIIINDGSTDNTEEVIRRFEDDRIILITQENQGIAAALNKGLQIAKAEYIIRFDADDICYPHRFVKQYQFMIHNPSYVIAGSSADYIDHKGDFVFAYYPVAYSDSEIRKILKKRCPLIHSSVIYKKTIALKHGGYNENAHSFEDHLLWQAMINSGKAINFHDSLIQVRLNPSSITIDEQWRPKKFHLIKNRALEEKNIGAEEGSKLLQILKAQNEKIFKESAYHALLAKKFLWNNHQPAKARMNLKKVITHNKLHWKSYFLYAVSFLPGKFLQKGYQFLKSQPVNVKLKPYGQ